MAEAYCLQILNALFGLDPSLQRISPVTAFLVSLSSSVLISIIQQFRLSHLEISMQGSILPNQLNEAAGRHLQALVLIKQNLRRYDLSFQEQIHDILSNSLQCARGDGHIIDIDCQELAMHRWVSGGTGCTPLGSVEAKELWPTAKATEQLWRFGSEPVRLHVRSKSHNICDGFQSICRPGYFDLGISGVLEGLTWAYTEQLTGIEIQSLRYG